MSVNESKVFIFAKSKKLTDMARNILQTFRENTKYLVELTKLFLDEGSNFFHFYTERCGKITCTFLTNFLESTK